MSTTIEEVVSLYRRCGSIKQVSRETKISEQTIRRLLITRGEYVTHLSAELSAMHESGLDAFAIAEKLRMSPKAVLSYLPYTRGPYSFGEKTKNAQRIRSWRERRKKLWQKGQYNSER